MNHKLTELEILTLNLITAYGGYKEAAQVRGVSAHTIKNALCSIRKKMGVRTTNQAIYKAAKEKLI